MNAHQHRIAWPTILFAAVVASTNIATGERLYPWFWIAWAAVAVAAGFTLVGIWKARDARS